jgi:hypothetical protein
MYTVAVDRRFWVSFFTLLYLIFGAPVVAGDLDAISQDIVDSILLVTSTLGAILIMLGLQVSWTKRPPSGKDFNEPKSEVIEALEKILHAD